jgi:hypothetical protein
LISTTNIQIIANYIYFLKEWYNLVEDLQILRWNYTTRKMKKIDSDAIIALRLKKEIDDFFV